MRFGRRVHCVPIGICAGLLAASGFSVQAEDWPKAGLIRVISPNVAGSVGDNILRVITPQIEAQLNQKLVIENRSGAAGNIGTQAVVRSTPDGYTFLLAPTANYAVNQHLFKNLGFDPVKDLIPVAPLAEAPLVAITNTETGIKSLREFSARIKAPGSAFNYGSPGVGSPTHLAGATFALANGGRIVHVAYRGTPPLLSALLANSVQLAFPTYAPVQEHIKSGRLVPLAVAARQRIAELPDVPTAGEAGYPDLVFSNWWMLSAPRGTPAPIVERLSAAVRAALANPAAKEKIAGMGHQTMDMGPRESADFVKAESRRFKQLVESAGITVE